MNEENNNHEVFDTLVCVLLFLGIILFIILWLIGFDIIEPLIYPGLEALLIPITFGLFLWALLNIRDNLHYTPSKKPKKLEKEYKNDVDRAWRYHNKADIIFQRRVSFFLVAESMLLVSFVTTYLSPTELDIIRLAIAALGLIITSCWFYVNVRVVVRRRILKFDYLERHDPIYYKVMKSVRGPPASSVVAYILPNSIIFFWFFLFFITIEDNLYIVITKLLTWSLYFLILINLIMRVSLRKKIDCEL